MQVAFVVFDGVLDPDEMAGAPTETLPPGYWAYVLEFALPIGDHIPVISLAVTWLTSRHLMHRVQSIQDISDKRDEVTVPYQVFRCHLDSLTTHSIHADADLVALEDSPPLTQEIREHVEINYVPVTAEVSPVDKMVTMIDDVTFGLLPWRYEVNQPEWRVIIEGFNSNVDAEISYEAGNCDEGTRAFETVLRRYLHIPPSENTVPSKTLLDILDECTRRMENGTLSAGMHDARSRLLYAAYTYRDNIWNALVQAARGHISQLRTDVIIGRTPPDDVPVWLLDPKGQPAEESVWHGG